MTESVAFESFHDDEGTTVTRKIEVEHLHDIRVNEPSKALGLDSHAIGGCGVVAMAAAQDFAHEMRAEQSVLDDVGRTHAALAQQRHRPICGAFEWVRTIESGIYERSHEVLVGDR